MRLERVLPALVLSLIAVWAIGFTVAALLDNQLPSDMTLGAVVGAVLLPGFFAACVLGLLVSPLIRAMEDDGDQDGPLPSTR